jgi:hypothetical protein
MTEALEKDGRIRAMSDSYRYDLITRRRILASQPPDRDHSGSDNQPPDPLAPLSNFAAIAVIMALRPAARRARY